MFQLFFGKTNKKESIFLFVSPEGEVTLMHITVFFFGFTNKGGKVKWNITLCWQSDLKQNFRGENSHPPSKKTKEESEFHFHRF